MSIRKRRVSRVLPGLLALLTLSDLAAAFDVTGQSTEPVKVQADWAELDERKGQSRYRGNVVVRQGKSMIEASEIVIRADERGIAHFEATGKPAHMLIFDADAKEETNAWAHALIYDAEKNQVVLSKEARLTQPGSSFQGDRILYDTKSRIVSAESDQKKQGTGRVEIIYQPRRGDAAP